MKTTIDIADAVLTEAQGLAARERTTLKALVDEGLRRVLEERTTRRPFKLRDLSVGGGGLSEEFKDATWDEIRNASYGLPRR